jgi:hypothetical protein
MSIRLPGRVPRRLGLTERHYAGALYGTILVMALLAVEPENDPAAEVAATVAATMAVFWLAHVYAHSVAARLSSGRRLSWSHVREVLSHEWPMLQSALPALAALVLAAVGLFGTSTAITIGLSLGILELFGWGIYLGRRQGLGLGRAILVGVIDGSFGLALVALEALVH